MRIGLYGMPAAGKTHILDQIDFMEVEMGSRLLRKIDPEFDIRDEDGRKRDRVELAKQMAKKKDFIMDGHFAFGNEVAFTENDGEMYDVFLYLFISPEILKKRMVASEKNRKYAAYNIMEWQLREIDGLRKYCHQNNKDFYVIDSPPRNYFEDVSEIIRFIKEIVKGYSCVLFAKKCANDILKKSTSNTIVLLDGDRTLIIEDSSRAVFGYETHLYDGNFYTGYQAWRQNEEFKQYKVEKLTKLPIHVNEKVKIALTKDSFILTSGHKRVWGFIAGELQLNYYYGMEMSAETKFFVTKYLQKAGKRVVAYGDGMNDYYMLKQADEGFLVTKEDGSISSSLRERDMEGLIIV